MTSHLLNVLNYEEMALYREFSREKQGISSLEASSLKNSAVTSEQAVDIFFRKWLTAVFLVTAQGRSI